MDIAEESRSSFLTFVKKVWPDFIAGSHHKIIAKKFEAIASKKIKRLNLCKEMLNDVILFSWKFVDNCLPWSPGIVRQSEN